MNTPNKVAHAEPLFRRFAFMFSLILAGEVVFMLPFHLARFFRPIVLDVFGLSSTELGAAQGVYGILAMISYFAGGPLADRFPARKLLAASLWLTAAGGVYMATLPGYQGALFLWGLFGVTTILLFWAALIRATRNWGGRDKQGRAYGLLEGGRGLVASVFASLAVAVLGFVLPESYSTASFEEKQEALRVVIYGYTFLTAAVGTFVWFSIPDDYGAHEPRSEARGLRTDTAWARIVQVFRLPAVWFQAIIVVCAYVAYKGFDNYSLFGVEAYQLDEVDAARVVVLASWMRPIAALGAGLLGDRFNVARMTVISFSILLGSHLFFALTTPIPGALWMLLGNTLITVTVIFGLRGLYFALFEEAKVPLSLTGTAVGLVSLIGFTPDIFVAYVGGVLTDRSPGLAGYQDYFFFLAVFSAIGLISSALLMYMLHSGKRQQAPELG